MSKASQRAAKGYETEDEVYAILQNMQLKCFRNLSFKWKEVHPQGSHTRDASCELDFIIVYKNYCLIGEACISTKETKIKQHYSKLRDKFDLLILAYRQAQDKRGFWTKVGIPQEDVRLFDQVDSFKGFLIFPEIQKYDVNLQPVANFLIFYQPEWQMIFDYVSTIASYAQYPFLQLFDLVQQNSPNKFSVKENCEGNSFIVTENRIVASKAAMAHVFTFEISPYHLLGKARVFRRDSLPSLEPTGQNNSTYQRLLIPKKIREIRDTLSANPDFMFPNSILCVLSSGCEYSSSGDLLIPDTYGALSVVDGQHRLFSYADESIKTLVNTYARIMVTAIKFLNASNDEIVNSSARTFIEINMTQTGIQREHYDAIAFQILGETQPSALAAFLLLRLNEDSDNRIRGLFATNQANLGVIKANTAISALRQITDLRRMKDTRKNAPFRSSIENLMGLDLSEYDAITNDLEHAKSYVRVLIPGVKKYLVNLENLFPADWPRRPAPSSSLSYSKVFAGIVRLLAYLLGKGYTDWDTISKQLELLKLNVIRLRGLSDDYSEILFDPKDNKIPNASHGIAGSFEFFKRNMEDKPTSMLDIPRNPRV